MARLKQLNCFELRDVDKAIALITSGQTDVVVVNEHITVQKISSATPQNYTVQVNIQIMEDE